MGDVFVFNVVKRSKGAVMFAMKTLSGMQHRTKVTERTMVNSTLYESTKCSACYK